MKLKHFDMVAGCVQQDACKVKTKYSKTFNTYFFPVADSVLGIIFDWVGFLRTEKLWGNDDALFPATKVARGTDRQFIAVGLRRAHWSTSSPIRSVFKKAFQQVDLPYFHPHSLRRTLAHLGEFRCTTPEESKAWSQNLGHEKVLTNSSITAM